MTSGIKISHLIPLYRSGRFEEVINNNVTALAAPDTEVILADRNGDASFCDDLRRRFSDLPNVRVLCDNTNVHWVDNIAGLIDAACGTYVQILPHDDSTTKPAILAMIAALDAAPDTVLAYGRVCAYDLAGQRLPERDELNSREDPDQKSWTMEDVLPLLWVGRFNGAFKGVIRRDAAQHPTCRFTATPTTALSERAWLFSLALQGRFQFVPVDALHKRYYPDSTHRSWTIDADAVLEAGNLMKKSIEARIQDEALRAYALKDVSENCVLRVNAIRKGSKERVRYVATPSPDQDALRSTRIAWGQNI